MRIIIAIALLQLPSAAMLLSVAAAQSRGISFSGTLQPCASGQTVRLEAGRRYDITASSAAFDTVLHVYRSGGASTALAEDDDDGGDTNSRLDFVAPETADYLVCVSSFSGGRGGDYSLNVTPMAPLPPAVRRPARRERADWQVYLGYLGPDDPLDAGRRFDDYEINVGTGERALISLESSDFDPVLRVYVSGQRGGRPIQSDDDGGGHRNAFAVLAPEQGGSFVVRAIGFGEGDGGNYRLRVATEPVSRRTAEPADD